MRPERKDDDMDTASRFDGGTIIVTGAGSGIGLATVERLVADGAAVVAVDVSAARLDELAKTHGHDVVTCVPGDLVDDSTVSRAVEAAGDHIAGLANVAGIMDGFEPTAEITDATWDRVLAVNLTAMMRMTRAVLPAMMAQGRGSIVNVGSEAGLRGSAAGTPYTVSKHAVNGFTLSTAFFYGPKGIRCNAVAPGPVATNIEAPFRSEWAAARLGPLMQVNLPPVAQPAQLGAAIAWLLSDDSSNVSGAIVPVDGGWAAV
jgi:NAD(P)-dependent dehydrogenase (short-subunit alcohol dehydrogenase family)